MRNSSSNVLDVSLKVILFVLFLFFLGSAAFVQASPPKSNVKSKFYDFSEQLIDGEIRRPQNLYTDARQRVKFNRLLRLKRSFMKELMMTAKEKIFK